MGRYKISGENVRDAQIVKVDLKTYKEYQRIRASFSMHMRGGIRNTAPAGFLDYDKMIRLHLQLFYPGVLDPEKAMFPPIERTCYVGDDIYKADAEGEARQEKLEKEGWIEVRHPLLAGSII